MADRPESTVTREAGIAHTAETMACLEPPKAKRPGTPHLEPAAGMQPAGILILAHRRTIAFGLRSPEKVSFWGKLQGVEWFLSVTTRNQCRLTR